MTTMSLLRFASTLFTKLQAAHPKTRERIKSFIDEARARGAIPLGMRKTEAGTDAYWWVVYDASRFPSEDARWQYLQERSPPGIPLVVLTV
jgi:hypothetical protein